MITVIHVILAIWLVCMIPCWIKEYRERKSARSFSKTSNVGRFEHSIDDEQCVAPSEDDYIYEVPDDYE